MSARIPVQVYDLTDIKTRRDLMQKIQGLRGLWEISIKQRKLTRSLKANAYYWAAINPVFTDWVRSEWGDPTITNEQCHELLKRQVLGVKELVKDGEVLEITPTTHDMDSEEFGMFIEKATVWLAEFCNLIVLGPELFVEPPKRTLKQDLGESIIMARAQKQA